mgnify:CR=1 FL=1
MKRQRAKRIIYAFARCRFSRFSKRTFLNVFSVGIRDAAAMYS